MDVDKITQKLIAHYTDNARDLPWRSAPGIAHANPYYVWLSEIMLQQTTVAAVIPYFLKFTARWPAIQDLADASEVDVLAAWAGLGYYARARNLHKCAQVVTRTLGGQFSREEIDLRKLPGIGPYTAAAITAIAFGGRSVVVDANIERLVTRLFAIDTPLPAAKAEIYSYMDALTPTRNAGDFAQACMDMGALICTAKNPKCDICPVSAYCAAYLGGKPMAYPVKPPKKLRPLRNGRAYWVAMDDKVWLVTRPPSGLLGGMRALPDDGWRAQQNGDGAVPIGCKDSRLLGHVRHVFTHFTLDLEIVVCVLNQEFAGAFVEAQNTGQWWAISQIESAGLPTVFAKAAALANKYLRN